MSIASRSAAASAVLACALISSPAFAQRGFAPEVTAGVLFSPDYADVLDRAYPDAIDTSGIAGWLELGVGLRYRASERLHISLGVDLLLSAVVEENYYGDDDSYTNTVVLPKLRVMYAFQGKGSPYLVLEANMPNPSTGSERYEFDADGPGFGIGGGYLFSMGSQVELGYRRVPVEASYPLQPLPNETVNLGGFYVNYLHAF